VSLAAESRRLDRALFPDGPPDQPIPRNVPYERLDMAYAIGVLMTNRDLVRRLAAEREERARSDASAGT
jgi:hypothetical protein